MAYAGNVGSSETEKRKFYDRVETDVMAFSSCDLPYEITMTSVHKLLLQVSQRIWRHTRTVQRSEGQWPSRGTTVAGRVEEGKGQCLNRSASSS